MQKKALLEFFVTDDEIFTFIIRPKLPELGIEDKEPIVIRAEIKGTEIEEVIKSIKQDYTNIANGITNVADCDVTKFYAIGNQIFTEELMSYIDGFDAIYLVPFGQLHYLPLHTMKYKENYLIDLFEIAYLPSASVLKYIQHSDRIELDDSILLGGVDASDERINFVWETDQINELDYWEKGDKIYLNREECTKENFIKSCYQKKYIHLSSHGHFSNEDPLSSGLMLSGAYSASYLDGEGLEENDFGFVLTVRDIFEGLQLKADLFVLSACVTGDSEYKAGDELIGLTRSLIYAGAKSMIVTLFPVIKNATSSRKYPELQFARFYELLLKERMSKGAAFQKYIQTIKNHPVYNHPYYWMPFILVGNLK